MSKSQVTAKRKSKNNNSPNRSRGGPHAKRKTKFKTLKPRQFTAGQKYNFKGREHIAYMGQPDGSLRRIS